MGNAYQLLMDYALRALGRKSHSEAELKKKLKRRMSKLGGAPAHCERVIVRLKELGYLNDDQILQNYFEYRLIARPVGKFLFLQQMHRRGIPLEQARAEWDKRRIEERPLAKELVAKYQAKFAAMPMVARKKKIAALLASRGFSPDVVWDVASQYVK